MARPFFTIGHSNVPLERFLRLLAEHKVQVVLDARSRPYSRHAPHFSRDALQSALRDAGFGYAYLGGQLGGQPTGAQYYGADGRVLHAKVAQAEFFLDGMRRLERWALRYAVAVLCAEEDPSSCHRRLLVARVARERGHEVLHIRGDGSVVGDAELDGRTRQATLGGEPAASLAPPRHQAGLSAPRTVKPRDA